jgi:hypothetical protein
MRRLFRRLFLFLAVAFIAIQFVPVDRSTPAFDPAQTVERTLAVPPDVKAIFDRSCKDCHSDETVWPWYAKVAPVSWLLVSHVKSAREDMNLSEWGLADTSAQLDTLLEVCKQVKKGAMPLPSYTLVHRAATLRPNDVSTLCAWSEATRKALKLRQ